ncbi:TetR family transcriptional regulator C-terminal domain-containing protein [Nonomuraea salmonea]|uniref:LmrA/YxaF family transcription factor n=1 Tax=Nonomuraea salmonea TaxID=46181 RepID=UPI0036080517
MDGLAATAPDTTALLTGMITLLGDRLEASGWRKGCPVATVALELAATHDVLQQVCAEVYASWERILADRLAADGHPDADDTATTVLALIEGALLLARARRSRRPLDAASRRATLLLTTH